nr:EOG090X0864 [Ceriodaphnia reticulata]
MANSTGFLFLQFSSLVNPNLLTKIVTSALQKVEKTLYIQVKCLPSETKVSTCNKIVNQLYNISSKSAIDHFDTRVVLTDFRDSSTCSVPSLNKLQTSQTIDTIITLNPDNSFLEYLENKKDGVLNEALLVDLQSGDITSADALVNESSSSLMVNEDNMYEHVVIGGTFDQLHSGHKMLISAAILRAKKSLTIGVTDGVMIKTKKLWELIEPCHKRIERLKEFLMDVEPRLEYNVVPITDPYGPTAYVPTLQLLVVSEETLKGGYKVNQLRQAKGLSILDIYSISVIDDSQASAEEENKISSSSFRKRLLGTHLKPPKVITSKSKPYVIGLTGGIASGKTTIGNRLKKLGAHIIPCDQLGHSAYKKGTKCYQQMVEYFGESILSEDKEIDRKLLGPIVFSNKEHLEKLNSMVWPEIRRLFTEEINSLKKENFDGVVVLDAAILLEAGWDEDCADVWVSIIPKEEAISRIVQRDRITTEQATKRVESQLSNSDRVAKANVVICSIWEPSVTASQVLKAWQYVQEFLAN